MTFGLGGVGSLNLPYENIPTGPSYRDGGVSMPVAGGLILKAAIINHPVSQETHPVLIVSFALAEGGFTEEIMLVLERKELEGLSKLVRETVNGAIAGAERAR
jgi:hypothetical protein